MSVIDILTSVDSICKKYDKYDKQKDLNVSKSSSSISRKSELTVKEKNRALTVALNAEIRRTKARLLEEVPKLQRLLHKKVSGITELATRQDLVLALPERIQAISDWTANASKQTGAWAASAGRQEIKFDSTSDGRFDSEFFQQSEESSQFRNEYEMRRMKQDQGLDMISEGLNTLKKYGQ